MVESAPRFHISHDVVPTPWEQKGLVMRTLVETSSEELVLVDGNMAVGIIGEALIVRVGPDAYDAALTRPHARVFDFTGRPMKGWVMVDPAGLEDDAGFERWVRGGAAENDTCHTDSVAPSIARRQV